MMGACGVGAPASGINLRERKKAQTRRSLQREALRLFLAQGYEATTVEQIAAAAGVSHMTFFRYFPRKEDVVLADEYDPLFAELIAARPADEPMVEKVQRALQAGLARIYAADRDALFVRTRLMLSTPALRARQWEQQAATERLIAAALSSHPGRDAGDLRTRVVAAACLAAITTAIALWVESDGTLELPDLFDAAFAALQEGLAGTDE
jgi:AcrR family transcriptional regulator